MAATKKLTLTVGHFFRNRINTLVQVTQELQSGDLGYDQGYRFKDDKGNTYLPDGRWSIVSSKTDRDLITEYNQL